MNNTLPEARPILLTNRLKPKLSSLKLGISSKNMKEISKKRKNDRTMNGKESRTNKMVEPIKINISLNAYHYLKL